MLYFSLPPGPWPGAPGPWGAALQPHIVGHAALQPHIRGHAALQPHILAQAMLQPHIRGRSGPPPLLQGRDVDDMDEAERQAAVAAFGWPWFGADPAWQDYGPAALQAQALQKVRTRILRPEDPRAAGTRPAAPARNLARPAGRARAALADLWRWQGPFRVKAVAAELSSRLRVQDLGVYWLDEIGAAGQSTAHLLLRLVPPGRQRGFRYDEQIDKVLRAAVERQDRLPEILSQADEILQFYDAVTGLDRTGAPRLSELLETVWEVGTLVVMALKNEIAELRPYQRNDAVQPLILTPGHGSLPSGHATMSALASELLCALRFRNDPERCDQLDQLARRIAFNRVVAGVHFQMDSFAGYELGRRLAATLVAAAEGGNLPAAEPAFVIPHDATLSETAARPPAVPTDPARPIQALANWKLLWAAAAEELRQLRV